MNPDAWYHLARPDGWDFYTGHTINYREVMGGVVTCPDYTPVPSCGGGIHVTQHPNACFAGASLPCSVYLVGPVAGLVAIDATKRKAQTIRVVAEIADLDAFFGWDYTGLCAFLASIPQTPWFQPDGDPDPAWHLSTGKTWKEAWADGAAAGVGGSGAALTAVWAAVKGEAREAGGAVAVSAARTAAWRSVAAWSATRPGVVFGSVSGAAGDAAAGAALCYPCTGLPLASAHVASLQARWAVWQKGYALYGEVDGLLYVYGEKGLS